MLLRSTDVAPFTDADAAFVASVGPAIGRALRSTVARAAAAAEDLNAGPGLVVLNRRGAEDFATQAARAWLGEETTAHPALASVAASVRGTGRPAAVRVRTDAGRWLTLSGSTLDADGRVAILVEPARAPEIAPLLVAAYGLTPRERDVLREVLHGRPTKEIARRLRLAPVTVQDHLKSIFEKTDSVSRSELVARLYFDHFEPRLGDPLAPTGGFVERSPTNLG
jgi:DNA-binding CsgD family transcriptional regulator